VAWGAYGVTALLLLIPILDSLLGVWPLRLGQVTWRFGAVGMFSRALMTPLLGLLVGLVTAIYMGHRRVTRFLALLGWAGAALSLAAVGILGFDALQTRGQVQAEALAAFDTAAVVAVAKYLAGAVVAFLLGRGGWRAGRRSARPARPGDGDPAEPPVVIARQGGARRAPSAG
jgi:hypothetical protein